ncbi:MAG: AMP-binding protein [Opitutaceae bacterium]|jgi:O-succinylbenzoic acid--CoA ligase|nr:AMP-binding protein [Opitutaceae bacterium]
MERAALIARLREFAGAALVERDGACFLVDPAWGERERAQWEALAARRPDGWDGARGWLCVPTGGSAGTMKLARHDERTLGAAVEGFCAHFDVARVDAVGLLPAWHVSGLLAWVRCAWTGGRHTAVRWKDVESGASRPAGAGAFVSLVPTQLARLLDDAPAVAWLKTFRAVLLGGGPAWPEILAKARAAGVPVTLSYGMTETAAMVAAQRPEEFAAGDTSCGRALPHARIRAGDDGRVRVGGASLFFGYWPEARMPEADGDWSTDDLGELDGLGRLRVKGRADALIISGGEKVNPSEVEAALREAGGAALGDVAVVGVPHVRWGQEVVAVLWGDRTRETALREGVARLLAAAKRPRRYVWLAREAWPRDERGKLNRARLAELARE